MNGIWEVQTSESNSMHESFGSRESSVVSLYEMSYESLICCCLVEIET